MRRLRIEAAVRKWHASVIRRSAKCRIGISHHSTDNQAPKKERLMKSGTPTVESNQISILFTFFTFPVITPS
jgi:hypothetical protein